MMRIEPYRRERHFAALAEWCIAHAQEPWSPADLPGDDRPGAGFVAVQAVETEQVEFLACGFVYETGTNLWLGPHYLMVNPALHATEGGKVWGSEALDRVVVMLEAYVAAAGGGALGTFSEQPAVIARARRHGYRLRGRLPLLGKWVDAAEPAESLKQGNHG